MELLAHEGVDPEGAEAVVVGRSKLVGVPVARLLLLANATVTMCHSRTRDLDAVCARADILVAAVGVPRLLGAAAIKPGAVVIDVGVNRLEEGLVGDVDYDAAAEVAVGDHPGPRRRRPDDDRDAPPQHPAGRARPLGARMSPAAEAKTSAAAKPARASPIRSTGCGPARRSTSSPRSCSSS